MKKSTKNAVLSKKTIFILIGVVIVLAIALAGCIIYMNAIGNAYDETKKDTVNVVVEQGYTTDDIGALLAEKGIVKSASHFKYYSKFKGYDGKYQAGTYALSPSMKMSEIADIIISGKTNNMTFTIPEGYTIYQIADKLSDEGIVNGEKFKNELRNGTFNYKFLAGAQSGKNHLEGYLFPDTYTVSADADEHEIINMMLNQFDNVMTDKYRTQAKKLGYSLNEIIVIASIIERESQVENERAKVASVIYNRLDKGMELQMCSTVQYVLGKQKEALLDSDTRIDSPYNTYMNQGLPPGPICCPGAASIKAALYPADTDYLYFVVSDKLDGTQKFSSDYDQFLKDKDAYYKALEKQE